MPDGQEPLTARTVRSLAEVEAAAWDACAGDGNPFVSHAFLGALEDSGSVGAEAGWGPMHLLVEDQAGRLVGCAPLYVKGHSFGEYVFDHGWADAYERAGGRYYPKLQCAVPFSPVTGPRLLVRDGAERGRIRAALAGAMVEVADRLDVSSLHVTFLEEDEWSLCGELGLLQRTGLQFHWPNRGYEDFDDFLGALSSRKRKAIRRERREAAESGLTLRTLVGDEITTAHWDAFFRFYRNTSDRKWGHPYLNRAFFDLLGGRLGDRVVLMVAEDDGEPVAGALNLQGRDALYGRNWGCLGHVKFLHFELCYYRAIDYAIAHGLARVEAGAQGPHKVQRGYLPTSTWSAHWIADPDLRRAVARFLDHERPAIEREIAAWAGESPYRRDGDSR